jgi:uncharacterized membrane protein
MAVVSERCTVCHSSTPSQAGFATPPAGLVLDTLDQLETNAERVYQAAVLTRTMPIGNLSGMTDDERDQLAKWYSGLAKQ